MKPVIESLQNPRIKQAMRLRESSRHRKELCRTIIDGWREISVAINAGVKIETVFVDAADLPVESSQPAWLSHLGECLQPVSARVFEKLSYGQRGTGAVAIACTPDMTLDRLQLPDGALVLVLDRAEKPGNIGAVVRTAASAGAAAVILVDPACEVFNPNAIRASLGTVFSLPIAVSSLEPLAQWFDEQKMRVVRACVDGSLSMWQVDLTGRMAIVLGSEAHGLGTEWARPNWQAIRIPMAVGADSLNLSVSAAVLCYEAIRQRTTQN